MSIYIPGIAPPENCDKCTHPTCTLWQNREPDGRHKDCPIIELPPHGRLIDTYDLPECDLYDPFWQEHGYSHTIIDNAPTILPADPKDGDAQ